MSDDQISFGVETSKILEIISKQIYQSPLALLRENTQNAFDAILMRQALNEPGYVPEISIDIQPLKLTVTDNGVGMSRAVIENNFWKAGSSGKNTPEARAAGVVGTFGIGALANFGIASAMEVETQSIETKERIKTFANRDELDINQKCINVETLPSNDVFGTSVRASIMPEFRLDVAQAKQYIENFVRLLELPVRVNGEVISQQNIDEVAPRPKAAWEDKGRRKLGAILESDLELIISSNAEVWISLNKIQWNGSPIAGSVILRSNGGSLSTCRSGFGLAPASIASHFSFGGIVNLSNLQPTAGREALTTDSLNFIQGLVAPIEQYVCEKLSKLSQADSSQSFMNWVIAHSRYELCAKLKMNIEPGKNKLLGEIEQESKVKALNTYLGNDPQTISTFASEESPLLIFATTNPRQRCEKMYLEKYCDTNPIPNSPQILKTRSPDELSYAEGSLKFRLESILDEDYFLKSNVQFGEISHNLPMLVTNDGASTSVTLNAEAPVIQMILNLYSREYSAFGSFVKDFVRNSLFDKIAPFVPSSTRQGAEAFLKAIKRKRELFEIGESETDEFASVWDDYSTGKITMSQALDRVSTAPKKSVQTVRQSSSAKVADTVPDVVQNEQAIEESGAAGNLAESTAASSISRLDVSSDAKLLTIDSGDKPLRGYHTFLSLTDKARGEFGEFFLQPHKSSCVWGGQRVLFIFMHHSEKYGLYYDIQTKSPISVASGGGGIITATIMLKNKVFIPIPDVIMDDFIPSADGKKTFNIRYDLLRAEIN